MARVRIVPVIPCSNRGTCQLLDSSGHVLRYCAANSSLCVARCNCDEGFYGAGCEYDTDHFVAQDALRITACSNLGNSTSPTSLAILSETYKPPSTSAATTLACYTALQKLTANITNPDPSSWKSWIGVYLSY